MRYGIKVTKQSCATTLEGQKACPDFVFSSSSNATSFPRIGSCLARPYPQLPLRQLGHNPIAFDLSRNSASKPITLPHEFSSDGRTSSRSAQGNTPKPILRVKFAQVWPWAWSSSISEASREHLFAGESDIAHRWVFAKLWLFQTPNIAIILYACCACCSRTHLNALDASIRLARVAQHYFEMPVNSRPTLNCGELFVSNNKFFADIHPDHHHNAEKSQSAGRRVWPLRTS